MKKIIKIFVIIGLVFLPLVVKAEIKTQNLEETLTEENISHDLSNYKETDNQIPIYLFRGNGCAYCNNFLTFINSIIPEYGKYFKVVSYEVWNNKDNSRLMKDVADFLNQTVNGVPFYVIGDKTFVGYGASNDEEIKEAIMNLYNSKNRYDVMEEMKKENEDTTTSSKPILPWICLGIFISTAVILFVEYKNKNAIIKRIDLLEEKENKSSKIEDTKKKGKKENGKNNKN